MAKLKDKIENGLNDVRILILGGQVLIGSGFRTFFEPDFPKVPYGTQIAQLTGLGLMVIGLGPLLLPAAFHQIVEGGRETVRIKKLTTSVLNYGLLPFAVGLSEGLFLVAEKVFGARVAWTSALLIGFVAIGFWYGIGYLNTRRGTKNMAKNEREEKQDEAKGTPLTDKIKQVLTENRMVLPGTQALLGFQIVIFLMSDFDKLPVALKWTHFASLVAVSVSAVLLLAPAAYHRIAEQGEDSEQFHDYASKLMLSAMFFLGLGVAGDFMVVTWKVTHSFALAACSATALLAVYYGLWFGYSGWKRWSEKKRTV